MQLLREQEERWSFRYPKDQKDDDAKEYQKDDTYVCVECNESFVDSVNDQIERIERGREKELVEPRCLRCSFTLSQTRVPEASASSGKRPPPPPGHEVYAPPAVERPPVTTPKKKPPVLLPENDWEETSLMGPIPDVKPRSESRCDAAVHLPKLTALVNLGVSPKEAVKPKEPSEVPACVRMMGSQNRYTRQQALRSPPPLHPSIYLQALSMAFLLAPVEEVVETAMLVDVYNGFDSPSSSHMLELLKALWASLLP
jgi:hypothetical protein